MKLFAITYLVEDKKTYHIRILSALCKNEEEAYGIGIGIKVGRRDFPKGRFPHVVLQEIKEEFILKMAEEINATNNNTQRS